MCYCDGPLLPIAQIGILRGLGRSKDAEQLARKVLAIREESFSSESKESASAYHGLAEVLADCERSVDFVEGVAYQTIQFLSRGMSITMRGLVLWPLEIIKTLSMSEENHFSCSSFDSGTLRDLLRTVWQL